MLSRNILPDLTSRIYFLLVRSIDWIYSHFTWAKKNYFILLFIFCLTLYLGCGPYVNISIHQISELWLKGDSDLGLNVPKSNASHEIFSPCKYRGIDKYVLYFFIIFYHRHNLMLNNKKPVCVKFVNIHILFYVWQIHLRTQCGTRACHTH